MKSIVAILFDNVKEKREVFYIKCWSIIYQDYYPTQDRTLLVREVLEFLWSSELVLEFSLDAIHWLETFWVAVKLHWINISAIPTQIPFSVTGLYVFELYPKLM